MNTIVAPALTTIRVAMTDGSVQTYKSGHIAGAWSGYLIVEEVTQDDGLGATTHQPHYLLMAAIDRVEVGVDETITDPMEQSESASILFCAGLLTDDGELAGISG